MDGRGILHESEVPEEDEEVARERSGAVPIDAIGPGEEEADDAGREIVLSREEFDMLQAFHRVIPLPALSSSILRVYVDEDLQVPDDPGRKQAAPKLTVNGNDKQARSSPLARRVSRRPSGTLRPAKPHIEADLSAHTPKLDQSSATVVAMRPHE